MFIKEKINEVITHKIKAKYLEMKSVLEWFSHKSLGRI